ncbi:MAG: hypothetical protein AVDCRST_MAG45-1587, partial [uncultured Solirubrobacterales bacterium]
EPPRDESDDARPPARHVGGRPCGARGARPGRFGLRLARRHGRRRERQGPVRPEVRLVPHPRPRRHGRQAGSEPRRGVRPLARRRPRRGHHRRRDPGPDRLPGPREHDAGGSRRRRGRSRRRGLRRPRRRPRRRRSGRAGHRGTGRCHRRRADLHGGGLRGLPCALRRRRQRQHRPRPRRHRACRRRAGAGEPSEVRERSDHQPQRGDRAGLQRRRHAPELRRPAHAGADQGFDGLPVARWRWRL